MCRKFLVSKPSALAWKMWIYPSIHNMNRYVTFPLEENLKIFHPEKMKLNYSKISHWSFINSPAAELQQNKVAWGIFTTSACKVMAKTKM